MIEHEDALCFQEISEYEAREHLGKEFDARLDESRKREDAIRNFETELSRGGDLADRFHKDPTGILEERGVLRPQDQLQLQLDTPGVPDFPELDFTIIRCYWICYWYWRWVCVRIGGRTFCYRRLVLVCRRICIYRT